MNPAANIILTCRNLGLSLQLRGDRLAVRPADRTTPELLAQIRLHKPALLLLLEAEQYQLTPDRAPWLHVAGQIIAGEFDDGDRSLLESLLIGVRNIAHPQCAAAKARLETLLGRKRKEARR